MDRAMTRIGPLQIGIILLALATAVIHFVLAPVGGGVMFYLNGLGYITLVAALYLPQLRAYHQLIRWVLIGYTALTIVLWAILTGFDLGNPIGVIDKLIEVALIVLLVIEMRQMQR